MRKRKYTFPANPSPALTELANEMSCMNHVQKQAFNCGLLDGLTAHGDNMTPMYDMLGNKACPETYELGLKWAEKILKMANDAPPEHRGESYRMIENLQFGLSMKLLEAISAPQ